MLYLLVEDREGPPLRLSLDRDQVVLGRGERADIMLPALDVAERHALLERSHPRPILTDLTRRQRLHVNGRWVSSPVFLDRHDVVQLGSYRLTFWHPNDQRAVERALRARAEPLLLPISPSRPQGTDPRGQPELERLRSLVEELDRAPAFACDWDEALELAAGILTLRAKDIGVATTYARGLWEVEGLDGLPTGFWVLASLLDAWWDRAFPPPRRMRTRAKAVGWLVRHVEESIPDLGLQPWDEERVAHLEVATQRLVQVVRRRFGALSPDLSTLRAEVGALRLRLPPTS
ncbi:MAG: type VI secretion system ImpA family N-terminal domain-containing protein [Sandaracinaceae bacterium]